MYCRIGLMPCFWPVHRGVLKNFFRFSQCVFAVRKRHENSHDLLIHVGLAKQRDVYRVGAIGLRQGMCSAGNDCYEVGCWCVAVSKSAVLRLCSLSGDLCVLRWDRYRLSFRGRVRAGWRRLSLLRQVLGSRFLEML